MMNVYRENVHMSRKRGDREFPLRSRWYGGRLSWGDDYYPDNSNHEGDGRGGPRNGVACARPGDYNDPRTNESTPPSELL